MRDGVLDKGTAVQINQCQTEKKEGYAKDATRIVNYNAFIHP